MRMSFARSVVTAAACVLLGRLCPVSAQQSRHISGSVHGPDDSPVARTEVSIEGSGVQLTTDSGEFQFPLVPPLKVGFPATFHVNSWVIIDPCILQRGRTYLPDPDAETIKLKVLPRGDRRLLSGSALSCVIEDRSSRFTRPAPRSQGIPHPFLFSIRETDFENALDVPIGKSMVMGFSAFRWKPR